MMGGCSFDGAAGTTGSDDDGIVNPPDAASPDAATDATTCAAPVLIDDLFDNSDLGVPGPQSTGAGFMAVTNVGSGNGSATELATPGLEIQTSNNTPAAAPVHGVASNTSFAFNPEGMTVRLVVTAADIPRWNGIALALQSNQANLDAAGNSLVLRIRGSDTNSFQVDLGSQLPYANPLSLEQYDASTLADGFTVTWTLDATSWRYSVEGLRDNGDPVVDAGLFSSGQSPGDRLDSTAHLTIQIQGNSDDADARVLSVARVTLFNGRCP